MDDQSASRSRSIRIQSILMTVLLVFLAIIIVTGADETRGLSVPEGTLTGNVTWTLSDSPVDILGNLTIDSGATLTIQPGVLVNMADNSFLGVNGTLKALGTKPARISFLGSESGGFDRINVTSGGIAHLAFCTIDSMRGMSSSGSGTMVRIFNSTILSNSAGFTSSSGSEAWLINCTFFSTGNVSISGGTVHEGNWFSLTALKDNGEGPYTEGADLTIYATKPQDGSWYIYNSKTGDPKTGPDGNLFPIAVEKYLHEGSISTNKIKMTITMSAENDRWRKQENEWTISNDINYIWYLDFTPPEAPVNLMVTEKGGHWIHISWDFEGDDTRISNFVIEYKKYWEGEGDWDRVEPSPSNREWNITVEDSNPDGLFEEMDYDIRMLCMDGSSNPSEIVSIRAKTLDITNPEPPVEVELLEVGGTYVHVKWNWSSSNDIIDYGIILNGGDSNNELILVPTENNETQIYNLSGLDSETDYDIKMAAYDDGEIPNNSNWTKPISFRTRDITSPPKPTLSLAFIDPPIYISGSGYYNGSQMALQGSVTGENRTFIDVFVDLELYVHPNPDLPRPSSYQGNFFFFITVEEGAHSIKVRSVDPAGNKGPFSDEVSINIDRTLPLIGAEIPENRRFIVDSDDLFILASKATDDRGIHSISWMIEGPDGSNSEETDGTLSKTFSEGEWNITLIVSDLAGNKNSTTFKVISLVPDDIHPQATLVAPTSNIDIDHAPIFKISFSEDIQWTLLVANIEYSLGGGSDPIGMISSIDRENMTIEYELTRSLEGGMNYTFSLTSILDMRGNQGNNLSFEFRTIDDDRVDSDGDGIPDYYEVQKGFLSPSNPLDAEEDEDGDGLSNLREYQEGTDPAAPDTDGDGMTDSWEVEYGLNPRDRSDALSDPDGDSYTNLDEFRAGTNPNDGDDKPSASDEDNTLLLISIIFAVLLVLILIVVGILLVMRSRKKEAEAEVEEKGEQGVEEGPQTWSEQEESMRRDCPMCGASLEEGLDYCPECGATIASPETDDILEGSMDEDPVIGEDEVITPSIEEDLKKDVEGDTMEVEGIPDIDDGMNLNEPPTL